MWASEAIDGVRKVQNAYSIIATYLHLTAHLFMPYQPIQDKLSVDYIVVGAGSSGAVIANRLTEDGKTTVLLLEAGENPPTTSVLPGLVPYLKETPYDWNFKPEKERSTFFKDDVPHILQGKMLGGTSSISFMNYIRGFSENYDAWAKLVNDDAWRYKNLLKYFKRSEDLHNWDDYSLENRKYHGYRGYIDVSKDDKNATYFYLKAFKELGNQLVEDINGATPYGYTLPMIIVGNGYRQSSATYLSNKEVRENLILYRNTMVVKILFDNNKTAVGVAAIHDNEKFTFYAKKEVIVAAGVFNTPKLLMMSQIGPRKKLSKMNIGCISNLPVGKYLQFHNAVPTVTKMGSRTYQERLNPREFPTPVVLGSVGINNSTSLNYGSLGYLTNSKLFLIFCAFSFGYKNEYCDQFNKIAQGSEILFSVISLISPKSRGSVTLKSADYKDPPIIDLGMFSNNEDLDRLAEYIEHYMRVVSTSTFRAVGAEALYLDLPDTKAEYGSRDYWKSYVLKMALPFESYAGTCSMGKVVDTELRVFGVQNLRVADASVIPLITSGAMDITSMMIGEKAADLIKKTSSSRPYYHQCEDDNSSSNGSEENSDQEWNSSKNNKEQEWNSSKNNKEKCDRKWNSSKNNEEDSDEGYSDSKNHRNESKGDKDNYASEKNKGQTSSATITREEFAQYIQEIFSELQARVNSVIAELEKKASTAASYIKENMNSLVKEVEQSKERYIRNGIGSYDATYIDLFVQNIVQIFKEKQTVMDREMDGNNSNYTEAEKSEIKNNMSYYVKIIIQYIGQKRDEIKQRMTHERHGNNENGK